MAEAKVAMPRSVSAVHQLKEELCLNQMYHDDLRAGGTNHAALRQQEKLPARNAK